MSILTKSFVSSGDSEVEELSDSELVEAVEKLKTTNKHMKLENEIFLNYLAKNDPKLISGMTHTLDLANKIHANSGLQSLASQMSLNVGKRSNESLFSMTSRKSDASMLIGSSLTDPKYRVNFTMKIDLLNRERKNKENFYETFLKKSKINKENLNAELEEISVQISEITEAREIFEQSIVKEGTDPITQRIPAEKFVRYMEEWLKSAESIIGKLRLRTSTLRYKRKSLQSQLTQKEELGETLHPIDFEHMKIENQQLIEKIESKNNHLLELKKTTGEANLVLSKHKLFLQQQNKEFQSIQDKTVEYSNKLKSIKEDISTVEVELGVSKEQLNSISDLIDTYEIPDIIEYVHKKKELNTLKASRRLWERRNHVQKIALDTCTKTLHRMSIYVSDIMAPDNTSASLMLQSSMNKSVQKYSITLSYFFHLRPAYFIYKCFPSLLCTD